MFLKILVCLDGSAYAEQVLPYAVTEAELHGGQLVLLRVLTVAGIVGGGDTGFTAGAIDERLRQEEADAREYLEGIARQLKGTGPAADCVVVSGPPGEAIVDYAHGNGVSLIALATRGRSGLGRLVLGSIADYVVKQAGIPVLLIKPKKA